MVHPQSLRMMAHHPGHFEEYLNNFHQNPDQLGCQDTLDIG